MGITLDAGGLIAVDRDNRRVLATIETVQRRGEPVTIPCPALAQVWRDGARQARLSALLRHPRTELVALDPAAAKAVGMLCATTGVRDVVDVFVVLCALRRGDRVVTSDPADLHRIDAGLELIPV